MQVQPASSLKHQNPDPIFNQHIPHAIHAQKPLFDRFAVIFSVTVVWLYAFLLTVGGAYRHAAPKTQLYCRTDRSGLVSAAPWEFYALYVQKGLDLSKNNKKKKDKKAVEKVLQIAEKIGLKVIEASKHDLNMAVDSRPHQGLVLDASPLEMVNIRELETISVEGQKAPLWVVALDEVIDPQNLGAIIRSAYFFGAEGVVLCAKNSAPLSGVVSKASAGSLELIELLSCKNMMQFLSSSIENGWRVLGGSVSSKAIPLNEVEAGVPTMLEI